MGEIVNTDAQMIAQGLNEHGFNVYWQTVVGDNPQRLREALETAKRRADILITTGGSEALQMTMATILDDGDEIVIPEPFYPNYHTSITLAGATIRPIPTYVEEGYFYADRARVEACINEKTRAIMITNPGNPTGVVLTQEEMRMIADIAKKYNLFLICDEVYREFCYDDKFGVPTMGKYRDIDENLVIVDGMDYCTLFTCTPYGINTHRLLVRGIRIETITEKPVIYVANEAFRIEPLLVTPAVAAPMVLVFLIHLMVKYREPPKKKEGESDHAT